jgi:ribosomal protein L37AE/L43A
MARWKDTGPAANLGDIKMDELTKCPKCKTRTLVREGDELVCSQCHEHFSAPSGQPKEEPPKQGRHHNIQKRHKFYESHRKEITRDLLTLGRTATREKYGIPTASSLLSLEKRWLDPDQRAMVDRANSGPEAVKPAGKPTAKQNPGTSGDNRLPQFPEFSGSWDPQVQVKWLEVYAELVEDKETKAPNKETKAPTFNSQYHVVNYGEVLQFISDYIENAGCVPEKYTSSKDYIAAQWQPLVQLLDKRPLRP